MFPYAAELRTALAAAEDAADLIAAGVGGVTVREKGRADLVTAVDEAAEALILARIRADFPRDAIVAEETASARVRSGRRWIVDPIDGTTNFVHGHPFVCASVAFVDDGGPAVGVIHAPLLGEVYRAVRGGGTFLNDLPLSVSSVRDGARALLATGFPFREGKGDVDAYMLMLADALRATHGIRRAGSAALDLAYVAAGRVDAFFEIGLASWDVAAGILLVTEAGGRVTGWPGDEDEPLHTGRIVASNGGVHGAVEELLARHVDRL